MVKLEASASLAIRSFLAEKGIQGPLRIDLRSSGCCDSSLSLSVNHIRESDLIQEVAGLTLIMSPEIYQLVGEVTISYTDEIGRKGFLLTSEKPISEWDGFAVSIIRIEPN
jgi:Fe-S cluster assembly iron-binding protein IscA